MDYYSDTNGFKKTGTYTLENVSDNHGTIILHFTRKSGKPINEKEKYNFKFITSDSLYLSNEKGSIGYYKCNFPVRHRHR
jgi:uncharacterized protein YifE (UPF0438 family)